MEWVFHPPGDVTDFNPYWLIKPEGSRYRDPFCSLHCIAADDFFSKAALNDDIGGTVNTYRQPTYTKE